MPDDNPVLANVAVPRQAQPARSDGDSPSGSNPGREGVIRLLNDALASEMVRVLRHRQYPMLAVVVEPHAAADPTGHRSAPAPSHADRLAQRIVQLGGELDFRAATLAAAGAPDQGKLILEVLRENLAAERAAIESHRGFIRHLGGNDPITRRLLEDMLGTAESNVRELADRLRQLTAASGLRAM